MSWKGLFRKQTIVIQIAFTLPLDWNYISFNSKCVIYHHKLLFYRTHCHENNVTEYDFILTAITG